MAVVADALFFRVPTCLEIRHTRVRGLGKKNYAQWLSKDANCGSLSDPRLTRIEFYEIGQGVGWRISQI